MHDREKLSIFTNGLVEKVGGMEQIYRGNGLR